MNNNQQAAQHLLNNRKAGVTVTPLAAELSPKDCEHAFQIQAEMIALRSDAVAGWKCLLPLENGNIIAAPIFADTLQSGDNCALFMDGGKARVEPEIAFVLGTDLPARAEGYTADEVDAAIKGCHMALELMQARYREYPDATFFEKLADGMVNQGLFLGPEIEKSKAYAASKINITFDQQSGKQEMEGSHPNELPYKPVQWMINFMSQRGVNFKAGQAFITGSYKGIVEVDFNQETAISYADLGEYKVTFKEL
ncbi:hydratase [Psychromonas marina]|uniref:Hydratase n=1 Tax=Psychromonas marina TaxID=88364 RepID=A0ABQ6DWX3_9GAMM|nr:fumarylacetoacetate hydrolase family protein [Psychromonas marina]GLS89659.1 hydratase [Psychromonas marina]